MKDAFVNVPLMEEINSQPAGFKDEGKKEFGHHLRKALYGLRQASKECHDLLHDFLVNMGCEESVDDPTLYLVVTGD